jgi:hypothetical protein
VVREAEPILAFYPASGKCFIRTMVVRTGFYKTSLVLSFCCTSSGTENQRWGQRVSGTGPGNTALGGQRPFRSERSIKGRHPENYCPKMKRFTASRHYPIKDGTLGWGSSAMRHIRRMCPYPLLCSHLRLQRNSACAVVIPDN